MPTNKEKILVLLDFKNLLEEWEASKERSNETRSMILQRRGIAKKIIQECDCYKDVEAISTGGILSSAMSTTRKMYDPFEMIFENRPPYNFIGLVKDMVDETIGILDFNDGEKTPPEIDKKQMIDGELNHLENYAFIVMAIDPSKPELDDVHNGIKEVCQSFGIVAERIDENISNERITDRILDAIRKAQFVIVDISEKRPNVFYEAGYAHGFGKLPIYIARDGTALDFDIKDYPIIFFKNITILKAELTKRLKALKNS